MSHNQAVGATHDEPHIEGLQPGAKLLRGQYEILRFLSNGGFGITYLARDSLDRDVVIKECYPGALCQRNGDLVEPANPDHKDDLRAIIDLFIQEARNHARLVHPNIVDVHQVFEDNNTAYIAMDLIRGCDLLDYVENPDNKSGPDFIVQATEKMLSAVSFIHQSGMLHRDISPDNILIDENGEPILIDFGAAREQAANKSAALLTLRVIKDGYSPHEFYVRGADQGPSSDLYVLAATLYHAISGERPIDGQTRLNAFNNDQSDPYTPLAGRFKGYPDGFLKAIDKAMEVHATDRLQTALDWLRMFRGPGVMFDSFAYRPVSVIVGMDRKDEQAEKERIKAESENAEAVVTALLAGNSDLALGNEDKSEDDRAKFAPQDEAMATVDTIVKSGSGGSGKMIVGVAVVFAALAAGGYFIMAGDQPTPEATTATAQVPAAPVPDDAASEPVEQTAEAVTEPQPAEVASVPEPETSQDQPVEQTQAADVVTDAQPDIVAEPEPEVVEVTSSAPVTPVNLAENQVAFGHWDVEIPFSMSKRRSSTGNVIAINNLNPGQDKSVIGDWVERGATIFTLNSEPIRSDAPLAAQVLDDFSVDPDGYIRVAARYRTLGQTRAQNGLLALPAHRSFGLQNGYTFDVHHTGEAGWQTVVATIPQETAGGLQQGDVLLREVQSGVAISEPESLDDILAGLVSENNPEARLSVLRNGTEITAIMQLTQE
ncbi:serine/threonine protein kinase [Ruegeria halocynthiae]|uniref:Serine/threonine protein kinase n=1 Tax=Ruegeria halocynthiae TaxID=985054 RepID=A0A1H2Y8Q5_9RHOB|nr:serine/threonine-protein kinase [Ruegeria halocynthiae]SDX01602.1 serine/threonine protein kinase [Ruegeria halocynthiae]